MDGEPGKTIPVISRPSDNFEEEFSNDNNAPSMISQETKKIKEENPIVVR